MTGLQVVACSRDRAEVIGPVKGDPKAFQLSKTSCLLGCGISDKPIILSDPWVSLYEKWVVLGEDGAGSQDQGQTLLSSLPCFPGLDSFFLFTFLSHSITLIVLSSEEGTSELRLERLLQMVFGAMVRLPGLFCKPRNLNSRHPSPSDPVVQAPNTVLLQNPGILASVPPPSD